MRSGSKVPAIADARERESALDPARSFIVQAPAGSGKTELLVRRVLRLLAIVEEPEEILAITFTRKAAGEMRSRILAALRGAREEAMPADPHEAAGRELARRALERNDARGWDLIAWPSRLRIMTIDAFNGSLTHLLPRLSEVGARPEVSDNADDLYRAAVAECFQLAQTDPAARAQFRTLLLHLGNSMSRLEDLLLKMLAKRDQWLDKIVYRRAEYPEMRTIFESALLRAITESLREAADVFPPSLASELVDLAQHASRNLEPGDPSAAPLRDLRALPGDSIEQIPAWRAIAGFLLTKTGEWRRTVNKNQGFPPGEKTAKNRMMALLDALREHEPLRNALERITALPAPAFSGEEWRIVEAATDLLKLAAAQLEVVFRATGTVDHIYIALAAQRALGGEQHPTDIALALDHRISHILVDEFQDTSSLQSRLLAKLTAGWTGGDGRTLFLVGDPMQSIYRFREAEVGLFLKAREEGIGTVRLEPLTLRVNFRSRAGIVDWVNDIFPSVLSPADDIARGAVAYSSSVPFHPPGGNLPAVRFHAFAGRDDDAEAREMLARIRETRLEDPSKKIAILVRSRNHLREIVPLLREEGLPFRAIEIEALGERQILLDLLSLTRALLHPADRLAWFSILRAPWCGLLLADLLHVARSRAGTIPGALSEPETLASLTPDGRARAERLRAVLLPWIAQAGRIPLRRLVEGAWLSLGGAILANQIDFADAQAYLRLLDEIDTGSAAPDFAALAAGIAELRSGADPAADESLQIMTIHKAKGLEFDVVLLPGLGKRARSGERELIIWDTRINREGETDPLMAPIPAKGEENSATYDFIRAGRAEKDEHETGRLMYVAATRAKETLYLFAHFPVDAEGNPKPQASPASFLSKFPATFIEEFSRKTPAAPNASSAYSAFSVVNLKRVLPGFALPSLPPPVVLPEPLFSPAVLPEVAFFSRDYRAGGETRRLGIVLHGLLEAIAKEGLDRWSAERIDSSAPILLGALRNAGVPSGKLDAALERLSQALKSILADERGRWILSPRESAECEFSLTGSLDGRIRTIRIDRTFVEEGVRWIVDYKTGAHEGADPGKWIDQQVEMYRADLLNYAQLMKSYDPKPVRIGLYFTLPGVWKEVAWE